MLVVGEAPALPEALGLLERAIGYTRTGLRLVTPSLLSASTPCSDWSLADLLVHMDDSLAALTEAADLGHVGLTLPAPTNGLELVDRLRDRACALLGAWSNACLLEDVSVSGHPLRASTLACVGAVEVAVHGWDLTSACGQERALPTRLAEDLLRLSPLFVTAPDRPSRFAEPVAVPVGATPGARLLAFLGRRPTTLS